MSYVQLSPEHNFGKNKVVMTEPVYELKWSVGGEESTYPSSTSVQDHSLCSPPVVWSLSLVSKRKINDSYIIW